MDEDMTIILDKINFKMPALEYNFDRALKNKAEVAEVEKLLENKADRAAIESIIERVNKLEEAMTQRMQRQKTFDVLPVGEDEASEELN